MLATRTRSRYMFINAHTRNLDMWKDLLKRNEIKTTSPNEFKAYERPFKFLSNLKYRTSGISCKRSLYHQMTPSLDDCDCM